MADTHEPEFDESFIQLKIVMDLCRDEIRLQQLRREAKHWEAKVTYLTLEEIIKAWRNSRCLKKH